MLIDADEDTNIIEKRERKDCSIKKILFLKMIIPKICTLYFCLRPKEMEGDAVASVK